MSMVRSVVCPLSLLDSYTYLRHFSLLTTTVVRHHHDGIELFNDTKVRQVTRSTARRQQNSADVEDEDEDGNPGRYLRKRRPTAALDGFIEVNDDDEMNGGYATRIRAKRLASKANGGAPQPSQKERQQAQRAQRIQRRDARRGTSKAEVEDDFFPDHTSSGASADADGSPDDAPHTSSDLEPIPEPEPEPKPEDEGDGKPYSLRQRKEVNYAIPPPLEDLAKPPPRHGGGKKRQKWRWSECKRKGKTRVECQWRRAGSVDGHACSWRRLR